MKRFDAPEPKVLHLPTLLRRLAAGEILVPRFQRQFVWSDKQVTSLLESVYLGYPIGSILLWRYSATAPRLQVDESILGVTSTEPSVSSAYVLDGLQRLTTLYRCLMVDPELPGTPFDVLFDLASEQFVHRYSTVDQADELAVPVHAFFSSRRFLAEQARILELADEAALDRLVGVYARFQEYMLPIVTIDEADVRTVVTIFERINTQGTKLVGADFIRAVTWSEDFDLDTELQMMRESTGTTLEPLDDATLVKAMAICAGRDPTNESMLQLRMLTSRGLKEAVGTARRCLELVAEFVRRQIGVHSLEFVPYEAQVLEMVQVFSSDSTAAEWEQYLTRWFWSTTFSEAFRGRPDHAVAADLDTLRVHLSKGTVPSEAPTLRFDYSDLLKRSFRTNSSLSAGIGMLLLQQGVRSILSGEVLDTGQISTGFRANNFVPLVDSAAVGRTTGVPSFSNRVLANVVLVTERERLSLGRLTIAEGLQAGLVDGDLLETAGPSQMLPPDIKALLLEAPEDLLWERAARIGERVEGLVKAEPHSG